MLFVFGGNPRLSPWVTAEFCQEYAYIQIGRLHVHNEPGRWPILRWQHERFL
jgi:hypothetical protein